MEFSEETGADNGNERRFAVPTSKRELLITVHGIRTFGQWQIRLKNLVQKENPEVIVETYGYGYFSAVAFILPFIRWLAVREFRRRLRELLHQYRDANVSIVAHSFGTHIVAMGLRGLEPDEMPRVRTLILAGSVLKSNFDWAPLFDTNRLERVVNDCGINDGILILSHLFVLFMGMAGKVGFYGFTNEKLLNRYFPGGHSHYFQPPGADADAFMRQWWVPQLAHDKSPIWNDDRQSQGRLSGLLQGVWLTTTQTLDPIKFIVYGSVFIAGYHFVYSAPREAAALERDRGAAHDAAELLSSGEVQNAVQKALQVLTRPGQFIPQGYDVLYNALFNTSIRPKQIDVGGHGYNPIVKLSPTGDIVVLIDEHLSIWSPEGVNKFKTYDLDIISPSFSPDGSALYFHAGLSEIDLFDLLTKIKVKFSTLMIDTDLQPHFHLLALDRTNLASCNGKKIIGYFANAVSGSTNDLTVAWQRTLDIDGDCHVLGLYDRKNWLLVGTDKAEIVVFDLTKKEVLSKLQASTTEFKYGFEYEIIASDKYVVGEGSLEGYVLFGFSNEKPYRFKSVGFKPQISMDNHYLIHGWNGDLNSKDKLVIVDLSKGELSQNRLTCFCDLVAFYGSSQFITFDERRVLNLRNLPDGKIASELFVFDTDIAKAILLPRTNLVMGFRDDNLVSLARLGQKDNSLQYGRLGGLEILSTAMWLKDDIVLLEIHNVDRNDFFKTISITYKLVRWAKTGSEAIWSSQSDALPRARDEWSALVSRALARNEPIPSLDVLEAKIAADKLLPGNEFDVRVAGDARIVARQSQDGISLVDRVDRHVVFKIPQTPIKIGSLWISPDRTYVAAGSQDGLVKLWYLVTEKDGFLNFWHQKPEYVQIATLNAHGDEVKILDANPSQSLLLSADSRGGLRVWPLLTPEKLVDEEKLRH